MTEYKLKYEQSQELVSRLQDDLRYLRKEVDRLEHLGEQYFEAGRDFKTMIKAVHENELVKSKWNDFVMTLRLTGYD